MDKGHDKGQMSDREVMRQALEALNQATGMCAERTSTRRDIDEAITALRQALEQPDPVEEAVLAEREACAKVCDDRAMRCKKAAQEAVINGEHDEVSSIRSTAWQISVCATMIRARGE